MKSFIAGLAGDVASRPKAADCSLATAGFLMRIATVNREMTVARRMKLQTIIKSRFGLDDQTAAQLVEESAAVDRNAIDFTISPASSTKFFMKKAVARSSV